MLPISYIKNFFGAIYGGSLTDFNFTNEIGFKWIRKGAIWNNFEAEQGRYDFNQYDKLVEKCRYNKIKIMPTLNTIPEWGSNSPENNGFRATHYPPEGSLIKDYKNYISKVMEHYTDIEYFEFWNEPNVECFLHSKEENYKAYVDKILIPGASIVREYGKKVVGPSFALEWPTPTKGKARCFNLKDNIEAIESWLNYNDAWKYIDILSVHYVKGDTEKREMTGAENLMPLYDYFYDNWLKPGKLDGIWNTEAGLTATEVSRDYGFVAMEPWERSPYEQWVPRYTIPVIHWGLEHNWDFTDKYKIFWFKLKPGGGTLQPSCLVKKENNKVILSPAGEVMKTLISTITSADTIDTYKHAVKVGFGLHTPGKNYTFRNYSFKLDNNKTLITSWLNLPGINLIPTDNSKIEACIDGITKDGKLEINIINYRNGQKTEIKEFNWNREGILEIKIPRTIDPILYLQIER